MVLDPPVIERWLGSLQDFDSMLVDGRAFYRTHGVGNLLAVGALEVEPDDLLRITDNREVRVMRDHDDLPTHLRFSEHRNEKADHRLVVEVFLGLVENDWDTALVHEQVDDQQQCTAPGG